jgi:hypothetical protein
LGLEVVSYRYGPWKWYRGEDGEYIWIGGEWERRGEVRKWMDVPLHTPPLKRGVTTCEDCQEVARSALVKGIELKMAALIWCAALGYLW